MGTTHTAYTIFKVLAVTSDSNTIVTSSGSHTIKIWDEHNRQLEHTFKELTVGL